MWEGPVYDCQRCGACCVESGSVEGSAYVYLRKDEAKQMRRLGLSVVQSSGNSYLGVRTRLGGDGSPGCVAFRGEVGERCGCSIYSCRPSNCRAFTVGGALCRAAREEAGLPV